MNINKMDLTIVKRNKETRKKIINTESPFKSLNPYLYEINEINKELEKNKKNPEAPQRDETGKEDYTFYDAQIATKEQLEEEYKKSYKELEDHNTEIKPQLIQEELNSSICRQKPRVIVENLKIEDTLGLEIELVKDIMSVCISGVLMVGVSSLPITLPIGLIIGVLNNTSNKSAQETNRDILIAGLQLSKELNPNETIWTQLLNTRLNSYMLLEMHKLTNKIILGNELLPQQGKGKILTDIVIRTGITSLGILIQQLAEHSTILNGVKHGLSCLYMMQYIQSRFKMATNSL